MNQIASLNRSANGIQSPPVGIDITMLLAASSFIESFDGKQDPRSRESFEAVTTDYCNGSALLLPLPQSSLGEAPLLYQLWKQVNQVTSIPGVELSDEAFEKLISEGRAKEFEEYVEAFDYDFSRWIAFQFTSTLSQGHLQRADHWVKRRCYPIVHTMVGERRFPKLRRQLTTLMRKQELGCPPVYRDLLRNSDFPDLTHLCIAYSMSVVLRGFSYAIAIGARRDDPAAPLYRHHWVRHRIVDSFEENGIKCDTQTKTVKHFPWGLILKKVFDPKKPLVSRDPTSVGQVLMGIREQSSAVNAALRLGRFEEPINGRKMSRLTDAELQVVEWLRKAGVKLPRKADCDSLLRGFFREFAGVALEKGAQQLMSPEPEPGLVLLALGSAVVAARVRLEQVTTAGSSSFLNSLPYKMQVRFLRDSFWKYREDPNIRRAVRSIAESKLT